LLTSKVLLHSLKEIFPVSIFTGDTEVISILICLFPVPEIDPINERAVSPEFSTLSA
jgi:hypothetical protein